MSMADDDWIAKPLRVSVIAEDHNHVMVQARVHGEDPPHYAIMDFSRAGEAKEGVLGGDVKLLAMLNFQNGPVPQVGVTGITNEAVLEVVHHRLCYLNGLFPCDENAVAIAGVKTALDALYARTRNRQARGVEGKLVA